MSLPEFYTSQGATQAPKSLGSDEVALPKGPPPVAQALQHAQQALSLLHDTISQLSVRLAPVSADAPTSPGQLPSVASKSIHASHVAQQIAVTEIGIHEACSRLRAIMSQLEV